MKLRLELVLLLALVIGLGVIAAYYADQRGQQAAGMRTTSFSSSNEGALALYRWLERIVPGRVDRLAYRPFALSAAEGMMFVLGPTERYEPAQVAVVTEWVRDGGVLVMADSRPSPRSTLAPLLKAFDLELKIITQTSTATPVHPALGSPTIATLPVHTAVAIASTAPQPTLAPLAVADTHPIVAGQRFGDGYVIVVSSLHPFTNDGLRQPESAAFILNLLRWLPPNQKIVFDEFHHGFVPNADLRSLLLNHPFGWAILYGGAVIGLYILAGSRRFVRPLPLRSETARRSSVEYIDSIAGMLRRTRQIAYAAEHYRHMLRRRLGQPYGIPLTLDDAAFVDQLATTRPVDRQQLLRLLTDLRRPDLDEASLLKLVAEGDQLMR